MTTAAPTDHPAAETREIWRYAALFGLFALCCLTRLLHLDMKAIMHDETLFVYYMTFQIYEELSYQYLPILHGPAMLHLQALTFHLFGLSDFTMRLGCAMLGIAGFWWIWLWKPWLREPGIWIALAFYTLSPGLTYYQRFFRNDALMIFNTLWIITSLLYWYRTGKGSWMASAIIGAMVLFTNKESSLFVYFSIVTFALFWGIHDLVSGVLKGRSEEAEERARNAPMAPNPFWGVLLFAGFVTWTLTMVFEGIRYDDDVVENIGHDWFLRDVRSIPLALGWMSLTEQQRLEAAGMGTGAAWRMFYAGLFAASLLFSLFLKFAIDMRLGRELFVAGLWDRLYHSRWWIFGALGAAMAIYLLVFTTFFVNELGVAEIYSKTWSYWGGQHEWGRIGGPFHQHLANMLVYESASVVIVGLAWIVGMFTMRWSRLTGAAFFLYAIPVAAFHALAFSGKEYAAGGPGYTPIGIDVLKQFFFLSLAVGGAILILPKLGRLAFPFTFFGIIIYAIYYLNSESWKSVIRQRIYEAGDPVKLTNRHVSLWDYLEITFNFDGGTSLTIVLILTLFATIYTWKLLEQGDPFRAFLTWWTVTATGAACYAREAVPQVGIHAMLPLMLLASSYAGAFYMRSPTNSRKIALIAVYTAAALWTAKANFNLNFYNPDEPRESMVYGPAPRDIKNHAEFIKDYTAIAGVRTEPDGVPTWLRHPNRPEWHKEVRVGIRSPHVIWHLWWYMRDIENVEDRESVDRFVEEEWEFIFANVGDENRPALKEKYHIFRGNAIRFWLPRYLSTERMTDIWTALIPGHYSNDALETRASNAKKEWAKVWDYLLYRRTFQGGADGAGNMNGTDYIFCVRKDLY